METPKPVETPKPREAPKPIKRGYLGYDMDDPNYAAWCFLGKLHFERRQEIEAVKLAKAIINQPVPSFNFSPQK